MRPTTWNVSNVLGYNYNYDYYNERTGRVTYAQSIYDSTLDRSYQYDQMGALVVAHSGAEARASAYSGQWGTMDGPYSHGYDYDKFGNLTHRYGWGGEVQGGAPGQSSDLYYTYSNNKNQRDGFTYDPAGNLTNDLVQSYSYDATGQQRSASSNTYLIQQGYDGDGLRGQKIENGVTTWYVRSSVLGGQVVAEMDGSGNWSRGYVYAGGELLAVQQSNSVNWVHEDSVTKSKRITDIYGNIVSTVELDPWGADTNRSSNTAFQPQNFTGYIRDGNGGQDAMARRYSASGRFSQPDPYGGSYDFTDPQSLNRYAYTKNDPVNFTDPTGLDAGPPHCGPGTVATKDKKGDWQCVGTGVSVVTVTGSWDDMSGYLPSWTSNDVFIRILLISGGPQNPEQQQLTDAVNLASKILSESKTCKNLFSGNATRAIDLLKTLGRGYDPSRLGGIQLKDMGVKDAGTTASISNWRNGGYKVTGVRILINTNKAANFNDLNYLTATLIHELGHAFEILYGASTTPIKNDHDDPDGKIGKQNDTLVDDNCFR